MFASIHTITSVLKAQVCRSHLSRCFWSAVYFEREFLPCGTRNGRSVDTACQFAKNMSCT